MRVLVTGAAGCLGRAACRRLRECGHLVRGLDATDRPADFTGEWVQGDLLTHDPAAVAECEAVVHLAALVHRPEITDPSAYRRINVEGTRRLLDAARNAKRFIFSSTVGVYPRDHDLHADESTPVAPRTPYGASKLEAETIVRERGGLVLRFPLAYGPGDRGRMAALIRAVARGRFVLPGPCREPRSLVAADNAAEAMVLALQNGDSSGLYLVTDDDDASVRRLIEVIVTAAGRPMPPEIPLAVLWPAALAGGALAALRLPALLTPDTLLKLTRRLTFSCALARQQLGYRPVIAMEQGIRLEVDDLLGSGAGARVHEAEMGATQRS